MPRGQPPPLVRGGAQRRAAPPPGREQASRALSMVGQKCEVLTPHLEATSEPAWVLANCGQHCVQILTAYLQSKFVPSLSTVIK